MVAENCRIRLHAILVCSLAGLALLGGIRPASAQQDLGAVVCVGSETESVASVGPVRRVVLKDTEVVYRIGVRLADQEEVEEGLLTELSGSGEARCVRSDPEHSHVVVVSYMGVVQQDLTIDPDDPRYQLFGVGYGTSWEEAEQNATRVNSRFMTTYDGDGYEVLVREKWAVAGAAGREEERPAIETPPPTREPVDPQRPAEDMRPGAVFRDCGACPEMVVVPAGRFMMGSPEGEGSSIERPRHNVTIASAFGVGVYEVTFDEWDACVGAGGCVGHAPDDEGWGRGRRPVMNVSWHDAQAYVGWLSRETGERYRLLSEAEWEYVARAGTETARYWGESESGQCRYANGYDGTGHAKHAYYDIEEPVGCADGYADTAPVGSYTPNAFGLYDVLGNVSEWTQDCWNGSYSGAPTNGSVWQSGDCSQRVLRGASWLYGPRSLRSAVRFRFPVGLRSFSFGFRVARTIK